MNAIIDLGSELLVDLTRVRDGQMRLLLAVLGEPLVKGSPWTVLKKQFAATYPISQIWNSVR